MLELTFRADSTGSSDVSADLAAAMLDAAERRLALRVPPGVYRCHEVQVPSALDLRGEGAVLMNWHPNPSVKTKLLIAESQRDIRIQGLSFDLETANNFAYAMDFENCLNVCVEEVNVYNSHGELPRNTTHHGVLARGCSHVLIERSTFNRCQIKLQGGGGNAEHLVISNCMSINAHNYGISVVNGSPGQVTSHVEIDNCVLMGADAGGIYLGDDDDSAATSPTKFSDCIVRSCVVRGPYRPKQAGIHIRPSSTTNRVRVEGCDISVAFAGVLLGGEHVPGHVSRDIAIRDCKIDNCDYGSYVKTHGTGFEVSGCSGDSIHVLRPSDQPARNVVYRRNKVVQKGSIPEGGLITARGQTADIENMVVLDNALSPSTGDAVHLAAANGRAISALVDPPDGTVVSGAVTLK